jgi:hypothetical protein
MTLNYKMSKFENANKKDLVNDYYKPNPKVKEANTICPATITSNTEGNAGTYGRTKSLYSEQLLKKQLRQHFITIPQTKQDLNELHENLIKASKNVKYILTAQEEHDDGGKHYHIILTATAGITISVIHKKIMETNGDIMGSINYQTVKDIKASITYCKKDGTYLEYGIANTNNQKYQINDKILGEAYKNEKTLEENIEFIQESIPAYYTQYKEQIILELQAKDKKVKKKWKPKVWNTENTTLRPYQTTLWDLIQNEPRNRRIIWVSGKPNSGKSFMFNYIEQNYDYGIYQAGSTASLDNAVYGYDGEGAIAWDIPMNYDFETYGDALASTIEKFSDYGQYMTSKKYKGKKIQVIGHVIVFSNHPPLKQLAHRDVIHIRTNQGQTEAQKLKEYNITTKRTPQGKKVWKIPFTENGIEGTKYINCMTDLPKHIREIYE